MNHSGELELSSSQTSIKSRTFMLLFLNDKTCTAGSNKETTRIANVLRACQTNDSLQLVLVQEKDFSNGGCDFGFLAIPLWYGVDEYRVVSLRRLSSKNGSK